MGLEAGLKIWWNVDVQREEGPPRDETCTMKRGVGLETAARKLPEKSHLEARARTGMESRIKAKHKSPSSSFCRLTLQGSLRLPSFTLASSARGLV